jgi:hypothetical protein
MCQLAKNAHLFGSVFHDPPSDPKVRLEHGLAGTLFTFSAGEKSLQMVLCTTCRSYMDVGGNPFL